MIKITVCQCCEDLVNYSNCTYDEAMNIIVDDNSSNPDPSERNFHGNEYVIKDSKSKDCYGCRDDSSYW